MTGYTRQDLTNSIANGNVVDADDLDAEFDGIVAAFSQTTGHSHDGGIGEGAPITVVGPVQDLIVSAASVLPKTDNTLDLGSTTFEFKDLWIDGTANIDSLVADTADINGGTVDSVTIGGTTPGVGTFTTLGATTLNVTTANVTTLDATNVEVTNLRAKDGVSAATIADVTGVITIPSSVLTSADINGGTIDNTAVGATTPAAGAFTTLSGTTTVSSGTQFLAAGGSASVPSYAFTGDSNTGFYNMGASRIGVSTGNSITANFVGTGEGVFNVGDHVARTNVRTSSTEVHTPRIQVEGTGSNSAVSIVRNSTSADAPVYFSMGRSKGTVDGDNTVLADNDVVGRFQFVGADGTNLSIGALIRAEVDGIPATNSVPMELSFRTTGQGQVTPTEWLQIRSTGLTNLYGDVSFKKAISEQTFTVTGTTPALDPSNGTIQTWTLSGNSSPTDSLSAGESITLMISNAGAHSITWPTITWALDGGFAPLLSTTNFTVVVLWKVGSTLYGRY